jgi:acyl carrier protein
LTSKETAESFVAPRDNIERQLATLWEKLLTVRPVGIHDNFFELGGNSLLALRLMSQIEKNFGTNLPVATLYEVPTVEQLAKVLIQDAPVISWSSLVSLQPSGSKPPFFWIHGEVSDAFLPRYLGPDQPVYGLRHQSEDGQPARYTTVEEIAAHHLSEIRTVQAHGPYFLGGYCFGGLVGFEIAQQLQRQDEEVRLLVLLAPDVPGNYHSASVTLKTSGLSTNETLLGEKLHRYVRTLKAREPRHRLAYVVAGITGKIKENVLFPAMKIVNKAACKFYLGIGYPLPIALRSYYILDVYAHAVSGYEPDIYPGRVIVFKPAEESISVQLWETLAGHGLEVYEVPGQHGDVVNKETHVRLWAEQLKNCLERARPAVSKYDTGDLLSSAQPLKHGHANGSMSYS